MREIPFPVKVVVVKTASHPMILVCSPETIAAEDIIQLYAARFSIETAIEQMKGSLGCSDYQFRFYAPVCPSICFAIDFLKGRTASELIKKY